MYDLAFSQEILPRKDTDEPRINQRMHDITGKSNIWEKKDLVFDDEMEEHAIFYYQFYLLD